jgi:hypothetical protein
LLGFGDLEWRWKLGIAAVPALLFFLLLFTIPRSPRRLVNKGRVDEARQVVRHTVQENSEGELQAIIESIDCWSPSKHLNHLLPPLRTEALQLRKGDTM